MTSIKKYTMQEIHTCLEGLTMIRATAKLYYVYTVKIMYKIVNLITVSRVGGIA
jgi:hypothetical protein